MPALSIEGGAGCNTMRCIEVIIITGTSGSYFYRISASGLSDIVCDVVFGIENDGAVSWNGGNSCHIAAVRDGVAAGSNKTCARETFCDLYVRNWI